MRSLISPLLVATLQLISNPELSYSAITYVDATPSNTALPGGMDNLWHLRTGLGNGSNGVWTADEASSGVEDVAPLVTTITFAEAGGYRIFVYIWDSDDPGEDWDARIRLGSSGIYSRVQAS